jgi:transposase
MRKGFRQLEVDEFADLKHAMINKMKTKEAIAVYKKRGSEIEPIFGILKQGRRFREFLCRGKQMARMHLKIASIALNFGKMVREGIA